MNKSTSEHSTARFKQENLAREKDIANFVKKRDFDNRLKNIISNKNGLIELSKQVKAISTKRINKRFNK